MKKKTEKEKLTPVKPVETPEKKVKTVKAASTDAKALLDKMNKKRGI